MYTYEIFVQNDGAQLLEDIIKQKTFRGTKDTDTLIYYTYYIMCKNE